MSIKNLRQWIEEFKEGKFEGKSVTKQIYAGWYDWFCKEESLSNKTKVMGRKLKKINSDFVLDNFYIMFKNNKPAFSGRIYDTIIFVPVSKKEDAVNIGFTVVFNSDPNKVKYEVNYIYKRKDFHSDSWDEIIREINKIKEC